MSSPDFAQAQARLLARRRQREPDARARTAAQRESHLSSSLSRLPYPVGGLGAAALTAWDSVKGREGTRPAFRVGQVDAELLDEELLELLKGQVGEGLKLFGVGSTFPCISRKRPRPDPPICEAGRRCNRVLTQPPPPAEPARP